MSKRLQRLFSVLCALALLVGCVPAAMAEGEETASASVVTLAWDDADNQDAIRPQSVTASLYGGGTRYADVTLNAENNWTNLAAAPRCTEDGREISYEWKISGVPAGYTLKTAEKNGTTVVTASHKPETVSVSVRKAWQGDGNALSRRPASAAVQLLADGLPCGVETLSEANGWSATWKNLPKYKNAEGKAAEIAYTVTETAAAGYTSQVSGSQSAGYVITNTLETGRLVIVKQMQGAPAGANLGALKFQISGPDDRLPMTVSYSAFSGGRYTLDNVPAGAYLVKEIYTDGIVPGYTLDAKASTTVGSASVKGGGEATVTLTNCFIEAEEVAGEKKAAEKPEDADLGQLIFRIDGPDSRMPMTVTYDQFTDGKFVLEDVQMGTYTVVEVNAGSLVDGYTLDLESSNQGATAEVGKTTITAKLVNVYDKVSPSETPEPEPSETPGPSPEVTEEPTPEPTPAEPEYISIPVTKTWVDNDNRDGNRPAAVTVRLLADGAQVAMTTLSAANGWRHVFEGLPKYEESREIVYTVTEDAVPFYDTAINGFSITNVYKPEVTSVAVRKVWDDNNNAVGLRPTSIYVQLSNGYTAVLSEANNWSVRVDNLPTVVNGVRMQYTWTEQEVLGYKRTKVETIGDTTVFTNSLNKRPPTPTTPGTPTLIIEEYGTPLGLDIIINHVGDCFD